MKKGEYFTINWDELIRAQPDRESKEYQRSQKEKYGEMVFKATSVRKSRDFWGGKVGRIVSFQTPEQIDLGLFSGLGVQFTKRWRPDDP